MPSDTTRVTLSTVWGQQGHIMLRLASHEGSGPPAEAQCAPRTAQPASAGLQGARGELAPVAGPGSVPSKHTPSGSLSPW